MGKDLGHNWKIVNFTYEFNFVKNKLNHREHGVRELLIFKEASHEIISHVCENYR
ncbi:hypothetical protein FACS189497_09640 [Betaproteobacteria bacterium]|nr:hypothetical protein FACS189497_09640 [Betaproteobacteria bacterium]